MAAQTLRDYQQRGVDEIAAAIKRGAKRILVVLPTGGGKTTIFSSIIRNTSVRCAVLVHRRELATQAANRLREFGVDFGFVLAGEQPRPLARVQIAGVQTLVRRDKPPARLIIPDEAHLSTADTWQTILNEYPDSVVIGFTATPWRMGGKPLAGQYDEVIVISSPAELRQQGYLSPYVGFSYLAPDLTGVEKVGDEYNQKQTGAAMSAPAIVNNIVEQWLRHAWHLSTVVFAVTTDHSRQLTAQFQAAGVRAEHLDGKTPPEQRKAILARVDAGVTQVLCNVGVAVEGLDIPRLKCCVLARPTMSLSRALQMMGRVRRPWNGLTARIHDHAFVIRAHGLPDAERDYSLHAKQEDPKPLTTCTLCLALYSGLQCPACNHQNEQATERVGPEMLDTAEQYEFSSEDTPATQTAVERPPVKVEWNSVGREVEGVFQGTSEEETSFGKRKRYLVQGKKRTYSFPSTAQLNQKMASVITGDKIRVTFTGEQSISGGKTLKLFRVERDT